MNHLQLQASPTVQPVFRNYPAEARKKIENLRRLILEAATEMEEITQVEETLKWGEPSYLTKHGSTIRIDWKEKTPDRYAMYFQCTSKLVPTFKVFYTGIFNFEGGRAIFFQMDEALPEAELKKCITAGLRYHKIKHLPLLGM